MICPDTWVKLSFTKEDGSEEWRSVQVEKIGRHLALRPFEYEGRDLISLSHTRTGLLIWAFAPEREDDARELAALLDDGYDLSFYERGHAPVGMGKYVEKFLKRKGLWIEGKKHGRWEKPAKAAN